MIKEVTRDRVTYNEPPHRFEAGTPPIIQAIGSRRRARLHARGSAATRSMRMRRRCAIMRMTRLSQMNSIRIFGRAKDKGAIISFEMKDAHAHDVATVIDRSGVAVRAGTHCAQPLLARFGVTSTAARLSRSTIRSRKSTNSRRRCAKPKAFSL